MKPPKPLRYKGFGGFPCLPKMVLSHRSVSSIVALPMVITQELHNSLSPETPTEYGFQPLPDMWMDSLERRSGKHGRNKGGQMSLRPSSAWPQQAAAMVHPIRPKSM